MNPANNPCLPLLDLELCAHVIPFPNGDLVPFPNGDLVRADDASSMIFSETEPDKRSALESSISFQSTPRMVNRMDALRRSVETERAGGDRRKPAPRAGDHRAPKGGTLKCPCQKSELARLSGSGLIVADPRPYFVPRPRRPPSERRIAELMPQLGQCGAITAGRYRASCRGMRGGDVCLLCARGQSSVWGCSRVWG